VGLRDLRDITCRVVHNFKSWARRYPTINMLSEINLLISSINDNGFEPVICNPHEQDKWYEEKLAVKNITVYNFLNHFFNDIWHIQLLKNLKLVKILTYPSLKTGSTCLVVAKQSVGMFFFFKILQCLNLCTPNTLLLVQADE